MTKINNILLGAVALSILAPAFSSAEEGRAYVAGSVGLSIPANKLNYDDHDENRKNENIDPVKLKNSMNFGAAVGYKMSDNFRAELAFSYFNNFKFKANHKVNSEETLDQKNKSIAGFINGYYDIKEMNGFVPYLTVGLGFSQNKAGALVVNGPNEEPTLYANGNKQTEFAWNAGLGVAYNINEKITLDLLSYKYYDLGELTTEKNSSNHTYGGKLRVHSLSTGIRIKF